MMISIYRCLIFLSIVLPLMWLSGCALQPGIATRSESVKYLNIVNPLACADSLREADRYLESNGITLIYSVAAQKTLVCLPTPNWLMRNLSPLYLAGFSGGNVAWATDDSKVLLHELGHLFGLQIGLGLMAPLDSLAVFATGFTDEQLEELKR